MAANIYDWSLTAANNSNADADLTWAEGQAPSSVNNSARVMMQRTKELLVDIGGSLPAGGTPNGLTVTAQSAFTTYANGQVISFRATADNTAAATLSVNGIGARAIRKMDSTGDVALAAGEIQSTGIYIAQYSTALNGGAGAWLLVNPTRPADRTDYVPTGAVLEFAGSAAPTDFLMCYGQAISRTTYAALFAVINTTHGAGDGSTTFNVPDRRGRVAAGKDNMGGTSADRLTGLSGGVNGDVLGAVGGAEAHTLTVAQMPAHDHTVTGSTNASGDHTHSTLGSGFTSGGAAGVTSGSSALVSGTGPAGNHAHTVTGTAATSGSGSAHNNVQPTIIMNYIIRT